MGFNGLAGECQRHNIDHCRRLRISKYFLNIKTKCMPHSDVTNLSSTNNWEVSLGSFESWYDVVSDFEKLFSKNP